MRAPARRRSTELQKALAKGLNGARKFLEENADKATTLVKVRAWPLPHLLDVLRRRVACAARAERGSVDPNVAPAALNGLWGCRPTPSRRVSQKGAARALEEQVKKEAKRA